MNYSTSFQLNFTKMQGTGNDFIVFDNRSRDHALQDIVQWAPHLCHRRFGVGADGVIMMEPGQQADYRMIYRNADGSDAGMCGNGGRCLARYAVERLGFPSEHTFEVHGQHYRAEVSQGRVSLTFDDLTVAPQPCDPMTFHNKAGSLPEDLPQPGTMQQGLMPQQEELLLYRADTGTEHVVCPVSDDMLSKEEQITSWGRTIRQWEELFPTGVNVNFMAGRDVDRVSLETYERGVEDLTWSCGTGALASAITHDYLKQSSSGRRKVEVACRGGTLDVHFTFAKEDGQYTNLTLTGPADFVFEGTYNA